jgi:prepilin-type processing-associated H-X9-DG protein
MSLGKKGKGKMTKKILTKIDVLVSLVCILFLMFTLSSFARVSRKHAKFFICQNNLQQLGRAASIYLADNDYMFFDPFSWLYDEYCASPWACLWHNADCDFDGQLWQYLESDAVVLCPTFAQLAIEFGPDHQWHDETIPIEPQFGYSMNAYIGGLSGYHPDMDSLYDLKKAPSEVLLFTEENLWTIPGVSTHILNDTMLLVSLNPSNSLPFADCIGSFHKTLDGDLNSGVGNVVFVDGHVETAKPEESFILSWPNESW